MFNISITWLKTPLLGVNRLADVHLKTLSFRHFSCIISASQIWAPLFLACQLGKGVGGFPGSCCCLAACSSVGGLGCVSAVVTLSGYARYRQDKAQQAPPAIFHKFPCSGLWLLRRGPLTGKRKWACIQVHPCSCETKIVLAKWI